MSYAAKILNGVAKAVTKTGGPVTLTRTTTTRDPANPTRVTNVTATYTLSGVIMPETRYRPESAALVTRTIFIPDLLSIRNSGGTLVNSIGSVTMYTQSGDVITAGGKTYRLLDNEQPRINGVQAAAIHEAVQ